MATQYPQANKPVQFFQIITKEHLQGKSCHLPIKFLRKCGKGLAKVICLKTPNGEDWKVKLVNIDGKLWYGEGWKEFVQYYSIGHGHLLLFKYQRHSEFHVDIFDATKVEIEYPPKRVEIEKSSNNEEDCRTSKKRKVNSSFEFGSTSSVKHHSHKSIKGKEMNATLDRAKEFKTCNHSFDLVMRASYVGRRSLMTIPSEFGKTHFDLDKKKGKIIFRVLDDERIWPSRYTIRRTTGRLKFEVTGGWNKFLKENNLKVGDVCKFELIPETNMDFQVHIFRKTNEVNIDCPTSTKSCHEKDEATSQE